jgi:hypothetical protein
MKYLGIAVALGLAAVIATFARYESFDPCDWLEQDMTQALGMPAVVAQARIRASFMFRGIIEPTAQECLEDWWRLKAEGLPEEEEGKT